ncbi:aminotransferase class I/II-fold pyridoxal phosphate-dependent enzyme [Sodalis sp. RH21]|uniref:aminotransferase class I/II-fold pyridoxal phosphate-dependent enzyme n=1 Tax=unclassified Sodalis (in: enterobacteria) TaxID=2636512 RepID=UPI0039B58CDA
MIARKYLYHVDPQPVSDQATAEWLSAHCNGTTPDDIAASIAALVREKKLRAGARLPTIRTMASNLAISAGTVASAWAILRDDGIIDTRRRGGSFVQQLATGFYHAQHDEAWLPSDLAYNSADPELLPPIESALMAGTKVRNLHSSAREYIIEPLRQAVAAQWPFAAGAWAIASSHSQALLLALQGVIPAGATVAIEQPTNPALIDLVTRLGHEVIAIPCDREGPLPDVLEIAMARKPCALIYQPRGHLPLGHALSRERLGELAHIIRRAPGLMIIEDDAFGPLSAVPAQSLGTIFPLRTLLLRSYCRTYGLDLRICAIGGDKDMINKIRESQPLGLANQSRILQGALAHLITSRDTQALVARAKTLYARRRAALSQALLRRGIAVNGAGEGLILWVPVKDENQALLSLATHGIIAGAGSRCYFSAPAEHHLRIASSRLPDRFAQVEHLAALIAQASAGQAPDDFD